jgi:hypothetical protein
MIKNGDEIYVLLADGDGTMRSVNEPFGVAVTSEEEAKQFVTESEVGYSRSYAKIRVFETFTDAVSWKFPGFK